METLLLAFRVTVAFRFVVLLALLLLAIAFRRI